MSVKHCFDSLLMVVILVAAGCGSQRRAEGIAELRRIHTGLTDVQIVLSAGVTKDEFSRRLGDALLKIGDLQQSKNQVMEKFPEKDRAAVAQAYEHFAQGIEAYKTSKDYFGRKYEYEVWVDTVRMDEYQDVKSRFPNLDELPVVERASMDPSFEFYSRSDMLQALWKVAREETAQAKAIINKLAQE